MPDFGLSPWQRAGASALNTGNNMQRVALQQMLLRQRQQQLEQLNAYREAMAGVASEKAKSTGDLDASHANLYNQQAEGQRRKNVQQKDDEARRMHLGRMQHDPMAEMYVPLIANSPAALAGFAAHNVPGNASVVNMMTGQSMTPNPKPKTDNSGKMFKGMPIPVFNEMLKITADPKADDDTKQMIVRILNQRMSAKEQQPTNSPSSGSVMTATNPQTGQKIKSLDGGKTWQPQ